MNLIAQVLKVLCLPVSLHCCQSPPGMHLFRFEGKIQKIGTALRMDSAQASLSASGSDWEFLKATRRKAQQRKYTVVDIGAGVVGRGEGKRERERSL